MTRARGAVGEAIAAFGGLLDFGGTETSGPVRPRGALYVAVQVVTVGVVCAVLAVVRRLIRGDATEVAVGVLPLIVLAAALLTVPLAIHWFAAPENRVRGAVIAAGIVTIGALGVQVGVGWAALGLLPGLAVLLAVFVVAGAVFGALAPVETPST